MGRDIGHLLGCHDCSFGGRRQDGVGWAFTEFPLVAFKIRSDGSIGLPSGWLPLNKPIARKLGPAQVTISRIGFFPMPNGRRDIVLDAAVNFGSGTQSGVSAKGLRISFPSDWKGAPQVSFEGIGVEIDREGFYLKGEVSMQSTDAGLGFSGSATATLSAIDATVAAALRFGVDSSSGKPVPYTAVYLDLTLGTGIELFGTGLAIYGMQGLLALNFAPKREASQPWYSIDGNDWFHAAPEVGVRNLAKWKPQSGAFALGVGVTLGTTPKAKPFNGKFLLLFTLPGPVIFLEGRANILRELAELEKDTMFKALVAFDANVGTLQFGLDAKYRHKAKGELVDAAGGAEAFFDFHDASRWYLKLGLESPEAARIQATLNSFFKANAFLALDASHARFGAKAGFKVGGKYGPMELGASLYFGALVDLSWSPPQLQALVTIEGQAVAKAFGYGLSLNLAAAASVDAQRPFLIKGKASISAKVPFYGTAKAQVALEWSAPKGEPKPKAGAPLPAPELSLPLVSASLQHPKLSTSWSLVAGETLLPAGLADDAGQLLALEVLPQPPSNIGPADGGPVVPLDAVLDLRFSMPMEDLAAIAVNSAKSLPETLVGNASLGADAATARARYALLAVELSRWDAANGVWQVLAKANGDGDGNVDPSSGLYGVWRPTPAPAPGSTTTAGAQQLLRLWSVDPLSLLDSPSGEAAKTTLDGGGLVEPFITDASVKTTFGFAPWPLGPLPGTEVGWTGDDGPAVAFESGIIGTIVVVDDDGALAQALHLAWAEPVSSGAPPDDPRKASLRQIAASPWSAPWQPQTPSPAPVLVTIDLGAPARRVDLRCQAATTVTVLGHSTNCPWSQPIALAAPGGVATIEGEGITQLTLQAGGAFDLLWLRVERASLFGTLPAGKALGSSPSLAAHAHLFGAPGHVLPAGARLRLRISTRASQQSRPGIAATAPVTIEQALYFRTEGGPGLANLTLPGAGGKDAPALRDQDGKAVDIRGVAKPGPPALAGAVNDLTPYAVASLPPQGANGANPRHFRAVDLGVDFAPASVRALYRSQRRDLALRVRTGGGEALRGRDGLPLALQPRWLDVTALPNTPEQQQMLAQWQAATKVAVAGAALLQSARLRFAGAGPLPANAALHVEAVPLLLAEGPDAVGPAPSGWQAFGPAPGAATPWTVAQVADVRWLRPPTKTPNVAPDANPAAWSRLRWAGVPGAVDVAFGAIDVHLTLRCAPVPAPGPGACGVLLAAGTDATTGLCVWLDPCVGDLRIIWLADGTPTTLAAADIGPSLDRDLALRVRLEAGVCRVCLGGRVVLVAQRAELAAANGTLALFATGAVAPSFRDIRAEDLRPAAGPVAATDAGAVRLTPPVWSRSMRTGRFVDLRQLLASAPPKAEALDPGPTHAAAVDALSLAGAVPLPTLSPTVPSPAEARAAEALLVALEPHLQLLRAPRDGVQIGDLGSVDGRRAFLVRTEQSLDWQRTTLRLRSGTPSSLPARVAGAVDVLGPIVDAQGTLTAVDLIIRRPLTETLQPAFRAVGDPAIALAAVGPEVAFTATAPAGLLWREIFAAWAFDLWRPSEPAPVGATWTLQAKAIAAVGAPDKGFGLLAPAPATADVHLVATLAATKGAVGVLLRRQPGDDGPQIRLEWRPAASGGGTLQRWQRWRDNKGNEHMETLDLVAPPTPLGTLRLDVLAVGPTVVVFGNGRLCGAWQDPNPQPGHCGVWAAEGAIAKVTGFEVGSASAPPLRQRWDDLAASAGQIIDTAGASGGPSVWTVTADATAPTITGFAGFGVANAGAASKAASILRQTTAIASTSTAAPLASAWLLPGSEVLAGQTGALLLHVQLRPVAKGRCGVAVGWNGPGDAIVVSVEAATKVLRIDRFAAGVVAASTSAEVATNAGTWCALLVRFDADALEAYVDGKPAATLPLASAALGRIALCADGAKDAAFANPALFDLTPTAGPWTLATVGAPAPASPLQSHTGWRWREGWLRPERLDLSANAWQRALAGDASWQTLTLHATIRRSAGACGLLVGVRADSALRLRIDATASTFERLQQGTWQPLPGVGAGWQVLGAQAKLRLTVTSAQIQADLGVGAPITVAAANAAGGRVGCWADVDAVCAFGDLAVRPATLAERALLAIGPAIPSSLAGWVPAIAPTIADKGVGWGVVNGAPDWQLDNGAIVQHANTLAGANPGKAGATLSAEAFDAGAVLWCPTPLPSRCCITLRVANPDDDGIGLIFDLAEPGSPQQNLLRFDMDAQRGFRRVSRFDGSDATVLWRNADSFTPGRPMRWTFTLEPDRFSVHVDGVPLCTLPIAGPAIRFALYTYASIGARFADLRVVDLADGAPPQLVRSEFAWDDGTFTPDNGGTFAFTNAMLQVSAKPAAAATLRASGVDVADVRVSAVVAQANGGAGVVLRACTTSALRVEIDTTDWRLVAATAAPANDGATSALWTESVAATGPLPFAPTGQPRLICVDAIGPLVTVFIDGSAVGSAVVAEQANGGVGVWVAAAGSATFGFFEAIAAGWQRFGAAITTDDIDEGDAMRICAPHESTPPPSPPGSSRQLATDGAWPRSLPALVAALRRDGSTDAVRWLQAEPALELKAVALRCRDAAALVLAEPNAGDWPENTRLALEVERRRGPDPANPAIAPEPAAGSLATERSMLELARGGG